MFLLWSNIFSEVWAVIQLWVVLVPHHTCAGTWAQRGDVVRGREVQRGPGDVHHLVVIVVAGVVEAIDAPGPVSGVLHDSESCTQGDT